MLRYATYALITTTLAASLSPSAATGNIGCLFSETLCNPEKEWCYNDFAFGKCLSLYGNVHQEDLKGLQFGAKDLHTLEREMQRLFLLGYRWSHAYTQCVLQAVLFSIRSKSDLDISKCSVELDNDLEGALKVIEGEEMEQIDPRNLAIVRFTPSVANPHSDYADEFYFPPVEEMLPPFRGNEEDKQLKEGEEEGMEKEEGEKEHKDKEKEGDREVSKDDDHMEKEYQNTNKAPMKVPSTPVPLYEDDNKIPLEPLPREELEELPYLPMDEIPDDQVYLPDDYTFHDDFGLPPPAIPMSFYLEDDNDKKPSPYDSLTSNDYDYDLLFQSPYATPPRITSIYKRNMGALREIVDPPDRSEGGLEALVGSLFRKGEIKPATVKDWARMLSNHRSTIRGLSPKPRQEYTNGEKVYLPPPEPEPTRNFNGQRFLSGNVGYFQEQPILPTFREREQRPEEQQVGVPYYLPYERDYSHYYPPEPQSQIPELEPPKPVDDANYSPETLHPPYVKSDYEEQPIPKTFENGVSRFDKDSKPIVGGFDSEENNRNQHQWMMSDQAQKENPYSDFKNSHKDYKPSYGNPALPMGPHLSQDAYYGRPDYNYNNFNAYEYRDYPYYYDYGADYMDMAGQPNWNLHRDERLDVKKPGPFFKSDNDFAFDYKGTEDYNPGGNDWMGEMNDGEEESMLLAKLRESQGLNKDGTRIADDKNRQDVPDLLLTEEGYVDAANDESQRRRVYKGFPKAAYMVSAQNAIHGHEKDPLLTSPPPKEPESYVYITINGRFHTREEGEQLVHLILHLSGLDINDIEHMKVEESQVMFQLLPANSKGLTASHLANAISKDLRNKIKEKTEIEITKAGVGTKSSMSSVIYSSSQRQMLAAAAIVCGVCAALLVAATTLFFLRRNSKSKAKLQGIAAHDSEASKDYQDLCRARMAGKGDGKDPLASGPGHAHPIGSTGSGHAPGQRISSLSKESDNGNNSPSSRSSTSSWSEEPVMTNMDISTGHMVLSYMEDHLRNKDRLEQEWVALCAYEAEPCATNFALKPEHAQKNRYQDVVPYDHNRVILNEHANVGGSSYMNASSITDHDPRNPAYIATQGPLASTAADFWQLVWEQGSVVIVMLTRLTENGQALCHRYWPEEGSELYHIYEVHLVSEHIWCDDYLVRSFYLKNARTGETRTVTQFHFLSWPESGIPASTKALLEFRRKVNKSYRGRSCPIIVHCSDGVGRTGTYCLIDMVLNRMSKGAKEIDIAATLEHIRDQRPNMVKTKGQFEFVLMSVAEEVHAILKALPQ